MPNFIQAPAYFDGQVNIQPPVILVRSLPVRLGGVVILPQRYDRRLI